VDGRTRNPPVAARLFGSIELDIAGATLGPRDFGGIKPKQLFEILLLGRDRAVSKDRLADLLWGDRPPQRVAPTIETYVSVLRRQLGDQGGQAAQLILTEPGGYRLARDGVTTDLERFTMLLRSAAAARPPERRAFLEAATALGSSELLADEPYAEWAIADREHYRALQVQALIDLAEGCIELHDYRAALTAVEQVLALEPASERAHRAAMVAHYALGDRDEALRAHARCAAVLSRELGVTPGPETDELHLAIMRDADATDLPGLGRTSVAAGRMRAVLPIGYAGPPGARIAYQVVGDGPVDILFSPSLVSNLAATWDDPTYAAFLRRLAAIGRLILFDKRGTGLSDPAIDFPPVRERSDDLIGVLDAADSQRAILFGTCGGGGLCLQFASDHPDRTTALVLHNAMARMLVADDYPWGWLPEQYERFLAAFDEAWLGDGTGQVRRNPGLADDPRYCDWFARYMRLAANPWMSKRVAELNRELDVRSVLGAIRAPALVICRIEDVWLVPENSRYLAREIRGAKLVELPGVDHDPWVGDSEQVFTAVEAFVSGLVSPAAAP
jgi:DNA-binding SARP family transcriptional activator/pimeloyl-ACP methyl ester carboxylesterase